MKALVALAALLLSPHPAFAQGAILETLEDLGSIRSPESFRGTLPGRMDLSARMPPVRSQAPTGTCVSWAATYAAASYSLRGRGLGAALTLSPAFTYNQISHDRWCVAGTNVSQTLNLLRDKGALPIEEFAFDGGWCGRLPTPAELERAKQFRITSWTAFNATDGDKVKGQIARGVPVIFTMRATKKMAELKGDAVLNDDDTPGEGHAMVAVGFDDAKRAFLVQNSAGTGWADKGLGWFGYDFWKRNVGRSPAFVIE
jgi:C1A family cysteine protease